MDKLETLLKEKYGSNYRRISQHLPAYQIHNYIWVNLNANYSHYSEGYRSASVYYDEELVFYCGHKSVLNNDFMIDTILKVVDELVSKGGVK